MSVVKKFIIPCEFGGKTSPFAVYIGEPKPDVHPVQHQNTWLSKERGGQVPERVINSLERLHKLARENGICFAELCVYALKVATTHDDNAENAK
ncbi:DUF2610 domain-containing protein [Anaplasma phagocytophilum]|uniref:DUF2610 domain-containing protein n=2 Tax=Anaplasma phagocytophilum TaxID=948 RepID=A0A0F3Q3Q2_ANAPH|nr:DUF2610 domain-containing protein [Anaplasma phagocytophilum]EOA62109.1 hypothetical protein CRT38_02547 [Anaplasma phagocytophilum str. CRT38]KDB57031.1 hypothetical protein P030_03940 [Anaplasma phagocytophilum str. CRT35]KJV86074.1 hypothetical protein APHCRT_0676 [Anaplasma phagocytophilum str. CRT53-1]